MSHQLNHLLNQLRDSAHQQFKVVGRRRSMDLDYKDPAGTGSDGITLSLTSAKMTCNPLNTGSMGCPAESDHSPAPTKPEDVPKESPASAAADEALPGDVKNRGRRMERVRSWVRGHSSEPQENHWGCSEYFFTLLGSGAQYVKTENRFDQQLSSYDTRCASTVFIAAALIVIPFPVAAVIDTALPAAAAVALM